MRDALSDVLGTGQDDDAGVDRILAAAFFRKRPLQAGSSAHVVLLADRRPRAGRVGEVEGRGPSNGNNDGTNFLVPGAPAVPRRTLR